MLTCCHRCPNRPMGCFPYCLYPVGSFTSDRTDAEPPKWLVEYEEAMDRAAGIKK